ncbi:MAG: aspartate aminotransferase family protein [Flavobacteriales bacterium CG03_land_8_20_14_0_80_35_15]|nr:aspartate aminotransferase family protein [Flavobacteriales bacterium]OIO09282.1 MAG: aspartate aminotransferase family protein [Flavobacteriaceae bacterium CG1_02_35_72]PIR12595.1 MAG: aspartate aminotransferase family protein [Flavobacteriales bacterium CG11_big_fil_rev_8_21_14_0_20_35_7]PIV15901.1 MAG: aspartate aminotransferase family protein [Flavobacteriales bacterium CG03_land_8_20_14_0_80_35_15]PIX07213.1 MAG: aspartate aminotransferase family protein [Flavobacteriales bacterium CG_4
MKDDFFNYQAQTTPHPLAITISKAKGSHIYDDKGKAYLDFVAGVSANSLGHHPKKVIKAIKKQLGRYMHVMVYGEFIQKPPLDLCKLLAENLPKPLQTTYLTNSGTEATEGAIKLAKRITGRTEMIAAHQAYHGNTQGAMSICGQEEQNRAFRPLIPNSKFITFNHVADLTKITTHTAAVILETIQGGAGLIVPKNNYLRKVKARCQEVGALLILDEIQTGFSRTGKVFGFENYRVIPDIIIVGKGLGGGMPIGAFIASKAHMELLSHHPKLGHITTFGGHPVIAAAAFATLKELINPKLLAGVLEREQIIRSTLIHPEIKEIRGVGLMLAIIVKDADFATKVILTCLDRGLILFWLLFEGCAIRITPPLNISKFDLKKGCQLLLSVIDDLSKTE